MSVQPLRVGVIGAGTVGREVVRAFLERSPRLVPPDGAPLVLAAVAEKFTERAIANGIPESLLTDAPAHLVASEEIDIVVETMGGAEPAHTLVAAALHAGKSVVTANKHIVAHHGPELERLARDADVPFRFEAAVGGGIPLLSPIAQDLAANRIARVRGIVNGTTNYMLTAMTREGRDYAEVLAEAQAKGYAEADPTADVEGLDALNKLVILVRLAFGAWIDPSSVANRPGSTTGAPGLPGITGVTAADVEALARRGPRPAPHRHVAARRGRRDRGVRRAHGRPRGVAVRALRRGPQPDRGRRGSRRAGRVRGSRRGRRRPRPPRCCPTSSRSPAASAPPGQAAPPRRTLSRDRGPAGRRRVRRGAVGRLLPGRGLRRR